MNKPSSVTLAAIAFALGCGASAVGPLIVPPARAGTQPARWEYFCPNDIDRPWKPEGLAKLNKMGSEGWELVQQLVGPNGANGDVYCFRRQLP